MFIIKEFGFKPVYHKCPRPGWRTHQDFPQTTEAPLGKYKARVTLFPKRCWMKFEGIISPEGEQEKLLSFLFYFSKS